MAKVDADGLFTYQRVQTIDPEASPDLATILSRRTDKAPIVYLVNQYPSISHTFIRREIQALEQQGLEIIRTALRSGAGLIDSLDLSEERRTDRLLDDRLALVLASLWAAVTRPVGLARAATDMLRLSRRSDRSVLRHLIYLVEACRLARTIERKRAHHIHAHFGTNSAEVAMLAASIAGISFSFTAHGCEEYDKPEALGLRLKIARARFAVGVSFYGRAQLLRWCAPADRGKIQLVRCGLDFAALPEIGTIAAPRPIRFVSVARFCHEKALDTLLMAASLLAKTGKDFELVIVGDGELRPELETIIGREGLASRVRLTGWLDGEGVRREMLGARALVMSSYAENLPVVIMEAMALCRPVIATMVGGIAELVIEGETGWLAPASSIEDLAKAMEACLDASDEDLIRLGRQGRDRVERLHDVAVEARKLARLFP